MMKVLANSDGSRSVTIDTPHMLHKYTVHRSGEITNESGPVIRQPISADFDLETERRRAKQGGCCGQPTE